MRLLIPDLQALTSSVKESDALGHLFNASSKVQSIPGPTFTANLVVGVANQTQLLAVNGTRLPANICATCTNATAQATVSYDNRTALLELRPTLTGPQEVVLTYTGTGIRLAQISIVNALEIPGTLASWTPVGAGLHTWDVTNARSQSGEWLGSVSYDQGDKTTIRLELISSTWMEQNWDTLSEALKRGPFYLQHPAGSRYLSYCWLDGNLDQPNYTSSEHCSWAFKVVG